MEQLRFKDDSGNHYPEWNKNKISEVGFLKTSSIDKLIHQNEEVLNLVNYMDVYKQKEVSNKTVKNMPLTSANKNQISQNNLKKGDVLFTPSSETKRDIGHTLSIKEDIENAVYSYHLMRFRPNIEFDPNFLNYVFKTKKSYFQLSQFAQGLTRYTLSIKNLNKLEFNYPNSIKEQEKIGNYFSNLDKIINNKSRQLDLLELYKKDMLHKIFNLNLIYKNEIKNIQNLGDFIKIKTGKLNANQQVENGKYPFFTCSKKIYKIDNFSFDTECVLISGNGDLDVKYYNGKFDAYQRTYIIESQKIDTKYLYYFYTNLLNKIKQKSCGSVIKFIKLNDIKNINLNLPNIENQIKISNFLSSIDNRISNTKNELGNLNNLKKDMSEKMF